MNFGYVYILTNSAMPGLLKIGFTRRSAEERRRELSRATGVPEEFKIAYEIFSHDMVALEKLAHQALQIYRSNCNKEFFKISLNDAISTLRNLNHAINLKFQRHTEGVNEVFERYEAIEILGMLKQAHPNMIKSEISSVRIYQTALRCFLETTIEKSYESDFRKIPAVDQIIHRMDMEFIAGDGEDLEKLMFDPKNPVFVNARIFIEEMDRYSIINCTDLFTEEAAEEANNEYLRSLKKKLSK